MPRAVQAGVVYQRWPGNIYAHTLKVGKIKRRSKKTEQQRQTPASAASLAAPAARARWLRSASLAAALATHQAVSPAQPQTGQPAGQKDRAWVSLPCCWQRLRCRQYSQFPAHLSNTLLRLPLPCSCRASYTRESRPAVPAQACRRQKDNSGIFRGLFISRPPTLEQAKQQNRRAALLFIFLLAVFGLLMLFFSIQCLWQAWQAGRWGDSFWMESFISQVLIPFFPASVAFFGFSTTLAQAAIERVVGVEAMPLREAAASGDERFAPRRAAANQAQRGHCSR